MAKKKKIEFGKNTYPKYVTEVDKGNGRKDYYYGDGKKGEKSHGHTVTQDKKIEYARTPRGEVRVNNNPKPKKSSGCFITTATCQTLGKSDNCLELNTFRNYRDNWLAIQEDGKQLIHEYYDIAPKIVQNIQIKANAETIFATIWDNYLAECFEYIRIGENEKAKTLYVSMVKNLNYQFGDN